MRFPIFLFFLLIFSPLFATQAPDAAVIRYLQSNYSSFDLQREDLEDLRVSSSHHDRATNLQHIYVQQYHLDHPIEGAIAVLIQNDAGNIELLNHRFIKDLPRLQIDGTLLPASEIESKVISNSRDSAGHGQKFRIKGLIWIPVNNQWRLTYDIRNDAGDHYWRIWIDASSGQELRRQDLYRQCFFQHKTESNPCHPELSRRSFPATTATDSYLVYPLGVESPSHGTRVEVVQPSDELASPYGWHDSDGMEGHEFTDTRGNNVFAQDDPFGDNLQELRPDGGNDLHFIYDLDFNKAPQESVDAAITNLFYWTNINHDVFYHYGFDEAAGNFQVNNYGRGGSEGDQVYADAQDAADRNNAQFVVEEDGIPARMLMHLWSDNIFDTRLILTDSNGEQTLIEGIEGDFSRNNKLINHIITETPLILVEDLNANTHQACPTTGIANATEMEGKIALIDRGFCFFVEKVKSLQDLGAIAVIVCNNVSGDPVVMGGEDQSITIPSIMISQDQCQILKNLLAQGSLQAQIALRKNVGDLDSAYDNLIITHEYGHGISLRLSAGRNNVDCLNNQEQMGEGWSDYFGLMLTTDWLAASPQTPRGIGTYVSNQSPTGRGIRNYPYSTDRSINPMTYDMVEESPFTHAVGAIWCAMLWEMTWEIIATDGLSGDLYHGNGGNNKALRIVMEALKIQPCSPGFVDGRDAILKADELLYGGAHQYQIWKAFAGRGLGVNADQGSSNNTFDGTSDYDLPEVYTTQIANFRSIDQVDHIAIDFISLQEFDNASFKIQRSTDSINFVTIETFAGLSLSLNERALHFEDFNVTHGRLYYYRLLQTNNQERE
ncbi:MAG: hypothetical protein HKN76_16700, partial [Saprospiraceae bacterium]|nr:hypothetical protein [Saprospiraceae bacterium]